MTYDELQEYYSTLKSKLQSKECNYILNHDRAHNAIIESFMLNESNNINMYCGEMSVFRNDFYNYINKEHCSSNDDEDSLGNRLKKDVISALDSFIKRDDTCLNIYFETYNKNYCSDVIDKELFKEGSNANKIHFYSLSDELVLKKELFHIAYASPCMIRVETNSEIHEATCAINPPKNIIDSVTKIFNSFSLVGKEIKFLN